MERTDELKERIRQQPLNDRLEESSRRIGDMCSKGRCPKMTIPVQYDDDDFYINTTLADAQATIAALQARVKELEEITTVICGHCCEPMEIPSKAVLQSQLTQRTAELEAAKAERSKALESQQNMLQSMANWLAQLKPTHHPSYRKGVEEVIAAAFNGYRADKGQPVLLSEWQEQQIRLATLQAELERVRGLIKALPKVEGEIEVSSGVYNFILLKHDSGTGFLCGQIETEQTARAIAALLKHRQGMEGG